MRLTKQQIEYQKAILDEFDLSGQFSVGKDLIRWMAAEINLCHERISKPSALNERNVSDLAAELNLSRWEHFKRAIWIHHS